MSIADVPSRLGLKGTLALAAGVMVAFAGLGGAMQALQVGGGSDGPVAQQGPGLETAVAVVPASDTVTPGGSTTYEIVVQSATGGVGAYDFTVTMGEPTVGTITDVQPAGNPSQQTTDVTIASDGSSADVEVALANTNDSGPVTIATVAVTGQAPGSSVLALDVAALGTEGGQNYVITGTTDGSITVSTPPTTTAPPTTEPPTTTAPPTTAPPTTEPPTTAPPTTAPPATEPPGPPSTPTPEPSPESALSLQPDRRTIDTGATTTYDVVVETAEDGVGAYDVTVSVGDTAVATISDAEFRGDPAQDTREMDLAGDGSSVSLAAATADTDDSGSVSIAQVTVHGESTGSTDLSLTAAALGTEGGQDYTVTGTNGATVHVEAPPSPPSNAPPAADAGEDRTVDAGTGVTLDATDSSDPDGDDLSYAWSQSGGPAVSLSDADTAEPGFTAPEVDEATTLTFEVTVSDGRASDTDSVAVTVQPPEPTEPKPEMFTRDELTQAMYELSFSEVSAETSGQVEALFQCQPLADDVELSNLRTREEIAEDRFGMELEHPTLPDNLTTEQLVSVQKAWDSQCGPLPSDPPFTLDDLAQAKYGLPFAELSTETSMQVQRLYDHQPFPDGTDPNKLLTVEEIARMEYGIHYYDLDTAAKKQKVQQIYAAQFTSD